jgi:hypothetical protein
LLIHTSGLPARHLPGPTRRIHLLVHWHRGVRVIFAVALYLLYARADRVKLTVGVIAAIAAAVVIGSQRYFLRPSYASLAWRITGQTIARGA